MMVGMGALALRARFFLCEPLPLPIAELPLLLLRPNSLAKPDDLLEEEGEEEEKALFPPSLFCVLLSDPLSLALLVERTLLPEPFVEVVLVCVFVLVLVGCACVEVVGREGEEREVRREGGVEPLLRGIFTTWYMDLHTCTHITYTYVHLTKSGKNCQMSG